MNVTKHMKFPVKTVLLQYVGILFDLTSPALRYTSFLSNQTLLGICINLDIYIYIYIDVSEFDLST